jgi:hypothetical protein
VEILSQLLFINARVRSPRLSIETRSLMLVFYLVFLMRTYIIVNTIFEKID